MGYGFPAAMGAQAAFPNKLVIDIAGDGSFQMNSQELATVVQYQLPVKVVILNNGFLGMIRQWQEFFYGKRYASVFPGRGLSRLHQTGRGLWSRGSEGDQTRRGRPHAEEGFLHSRSLLSSILWLIGKKMSIPWFPAGEPLNQMRLV